jgi:hypothetical protein
MPEKVRALKASDGQLFLDGGKLVTHEIKQVVFKALGGTPENEPVADNVAAALTDNHVVLFDALKLLKVPKKRKPVVVAATSSKGK